MSVPTRSTHPTVRPPSAGADGAGWTGSLAVRVTGAALSLGIGWVHVVDQGGLPGDKAPRYVGIGYWLIELAAVALVALLLSPGTRQRLTGWVLAVGVAVGPFVGYVLSRGPGLPGYTDDRGNWTEPIGLWSLALELALAAVAVPAVLALLPSVQPSKVRV